MIKFSNLFFLIIFIFVSSCGYTTVYKSQEINNIRIVLGKLEGDENFNKILILKLKELTNSKSKDIIYLSVNTDLNKKVIAKDSRGKMTDYELNVQVNFEIKNEKISEKISFNESLKLSNNEDSFEQKRYENNIIDNFASSIKEKLVFKLNTLND